MNNEIFEKIKEFVIKQSYVTDVTLTKKTRIKDDLGVTGDDAVEFILAFGKEFNVDVSNFMAADYFEAEGNQFLSIIFNLFTNKGESEKKILTLEDLEKAVIAGKLDESVINPISF